MFTELEYAKTINRFKANKVKTQRPKKHDETWKQRKNVAIHKQSRSENMFNDEYSILPQPHVPRWEQHHLRALYPLGPGW